MQRKKIRALWLVLISTVIIAAAFVFVSARNDGPATSSSALEATQLPALTAPQDSNAAANLIRLTIYDTGIYPRELRAAKGLTIVKIEDFSGGTAGLVIARVNGNDRVPAGQVKRNGSHWRGSEQIQLQPGNYEVYTVEHPNNRSHLVVEP